MSKRIALHNSDATPPRRSFFAKFAAVVCGGIVALFPFAAGLGVITDPWRRKNKTSAGDEGGKLVPICPLAALPADGVPRAFPVVSEVADGWTKAVNQRIGMIFMS